MDYIKGLWIMDLPHLRRGSSVRGQRLVPLRLDDERVAVLSRLGDQCSVISVQCWVLGVQ